MRRMSLAVVVAATASLLGAAEAMADPVEDFYRGKTITMLIGTGEGGGAVEDYPRALAQVMRKYIPGNPTFVVSNMPGAGGIKAANYIASVAPQDGTTWGFITRGFLLAPLLKIQQANFDPTRFNWIGSPARSVSVGVVWTAASPVRAIADASAQQVIVGATSIGQDTGVFPAMLNRFAGTNFKIVPGYPSVGDIDLAMERAEVQGKIGFTWASLNSGRTVDWVKDGKVAVIVQLGVAKAADIPASVPLALDLAKTRTTARRWRSSARPPQPAIPPSWARACRRIASRRSERPTRRRCTTRNSSPSCASRARRSIRSAPTRSPRPSTTCMPCRHRR